MKIFFIGDIVGKAGREAVKKVVEKWREKVDFFIANAENAAGGNGITPRVAEELFSIGINVLTTGNHIWDKKEIMEIIEKEERLLRPANYPPQAPGRGGGVYKTIQGDKIGVINIAGRVFMPCLDCPFRVVLREIERIKKETPCIIVDVHGEATSEKMALGFYLNGKVSAVIGTHTHVQTADEMILSEGTAYITDVGMTGAFDSIIGVKKEEVLTRFLTQIPVRFKAAKGNVWVNGVVVEIQRDNGKAVRIQRVKERLE